MRRNAGANYYDIMLCAAHVAVEDETMYYHKQYYTVHLIQYYVGTADVRKR